MENVAHSMFEVKPISARLGAEVVGFDLSRDMDAATSARLRTLLLRHGILLFRRQILRPQQHLKLARSLGQPTPASPILPAMDEVRSEIKVIDSRVRELPSQTSQGDSTVWMTDMSYIVTPPSVAVYIARVVPTVGGEEQWLSTTGAYDALPENLKQRLRGLVAVHGDPVLSGLVTVDRPGKWDGRILTILPEVEHPVVCSHPDSGLPLLFINPRFTKYIKGMERDESAALLKTLFGHMTSAAPSITHRWQAGDVMLSDNRSTLHRTRRVAEIHPRIIHRISLRGDRPSAP